MLADANFESGGRRASKKVSEKSNRVERLAHEAERRNDETDGRIEKYDITATTTRPAQ